MPLLEGYYLRNMLEENRRVLFLQLFRIEGGGSLLSELTICLLSPTIVGDRKENCAPAKKLSNVGLVQQGAASRGRLEFEFEGDDKLFIEFSDGCYFDVRRPITRFQS